MLHGAVATRASAARRFGQGDGSCDVCAATPSGEASTAPQDTLAHFFLYCPRVSAFWRLVIDFLRHATGAPHLQTPSCHDLLTGWTSVKDVVPSPGTLCALACWQVYRAKTELFTDNKLSPPTTLFARWLAAVRERVRVDFHSLNRSGKISARFRRWWLKPATRWIAIEPGGRLAIARLPQTLHC